MKKMVWTVAVLGMAASFALGEDMVDNPAYKQWSAFKVGTMVKRQTSSTISMGDKEMVNKSTMTMTLKELTAEKAVVEVVVEVEMNGKKTTMPAQTQEILAKVPKTAASGPATPPDVKVTKTEGDEEIEVAGKKYKAHWVEIKTTGDKTESTMKSWTSNDVPGAMLKMTMEQTKPMKMQMTTEVVEFKAGA